MEDRRMPQSFFEKEFDDGTKAKLTIFRRYIREWISALLTRSRRQFHQLNVYDFFAGPGKDVKDNLGSPLIIIDEIKAFCQNRGAQKAQIPVQIVFNDKNEEHIAELMNEVSKARCPESCCMFEFNALPFNSALSKYLNQMQDSGNANLVLMDQFGVKEVTPEIVNVLLGCGSTDALFFISTSFISRFIKTPEIQDAFSLDPKEMRDVEYRVIHRYICDYYRSALRNHGSMVAPFSIKKGGNIYGLIFATQHMLGMEKFLKVCWDLDPSTGEANYNIDKDPAWNGERFLLPEMNAITKIELFEHSLRQFIEDRVPSNRELYRFCLEQGFCASKANLSLRKLQNGQIINTSNISNGSPARKGSFYLKDKMDRVRFGIN